LEERTTVSDIDWAVVSSGLDFLHSAVDHLAGGTERDLRYAALHLSTAIETLLKAQLARADLALVFDDPARADPAAYQRGDFKSVGINEAVRRLRHELGASITDEEARGIRAVANVRNRVAHFALHGEELRRTEATLARGLDALLGFIDREFVPSANTEEKSLIETTLERVREQLGRIEALVDARMATLRSALHAAYTVACCPGCTLDAYVLGDGPGRCLYCLHHPDAESAAAEYVTAIRGVSSYYETFKDGGEWPVYQCVECGAEAFVVTTDTAETDPDVAIWICYACGHTCADTDIGQCVDCRIMTYRERDNLPVCDDCRDHALAD
jgi:hypothetical protein